MSVIDSFSNSVVRQTWKQIEDTINCFQYLLIFNYSSIINTFQQICLGKWFDVAQEDTTIKIPMALYLYFVCIFGHIIFHICITFESRRRRLEKKKINRRCQTPITSLGTLGNIWIRNFSFFFFVGGIAIAER